MSGIQGGDTLSKGTLVREATTNRAARVAARLLTTLAGVALVGWSLLADPRWAERHVLGLYCATSSGAWLLTRGFRWVGAAAGVAVVWKLAPALASRAGRLSVRRHAGASAGIAVAVVAALGVAEVVARRLNERLILGGGAPSRGGREAAMTRAEARLGWSYYPGRTTWVRVQDRNIAYAIDDDGDRARSADDHPHPDRPTILVAGESIAFGYGLPYEETFPYLVGRHLGLQVVNLAVVGYGSDQAHLRVLDALPRFRRPLAVVTLFLPDQLKRNVEPWRPRLGVGTDGALVPVPASRGPRLTRLLRQLPYHDDEAVRVTAAILRATAAEARARGAVPLFVVTNFGPACRGEDGGEAWIVNELFVRQALPFVRVELDPEDRLPGTFERHPSLRGTRKLADAVERALRERLGARVVGAGARPAE